MRHTSLLRPLYYLLYNQFSWVDDFVAALVSLAQWQDWVQSALTYLNGRVLELGFGPGHLQLSLYEENILAFGLDASRQMAHQSKRLLEARPKSSRFSEFGSTLRDSPNQE
jgi:ubiquinone/menaquinone biosynthesis C-methylase UbiE